MMEPSRLDLDFIVAGFPLICKVWKLEQKQP